MDLRAGRKSGTGNGAAAFNGTLPTTLYFVFKVLTLVVPGYVTYLGYDLFIRGVTGSASLVVEHKEVSGQLLNAAPGLFFALSGVLCLGISIWKGIDFKA